MQQVKVWKTSDGMLIEDLQKAVKHEKIYQIHSLLLGYQRDQQQQDYIEDGGDIDLERLAVVIVENKEVWLKILQSSEEELLSQGKI